MAFRDGLLVVGVLMVVCWAFIITWLGGWGTSTSDVVIEVWTTIIFLIAAAVGLLESRSVWASS